MNSLFVLDGNSLLWIGNTGSPFTRNPAKNVNLGGIYYILSKIAYYHNQGIDMCVVFDSHSDGKKYIEGYKSGRVHDPVVTFQGEILHELLTQSGLSCYKEYGKEGDRLVFDVVLNNLNDYDRICVMSGDYDLTAMVCDKVDFLNPKLGGIHVNMSNYSDVVDKRFKVPYNTISVMKMIFGDNSDSVRAIYGDDYDKALFKRYLGFCNDNNIAPYYRSFKIIIDKFIGTLEDESLKKILSNRAEVMSVQFEKNDRYKFTGKMDNFKDICEKFGAENAYRLTEKYNVKMDTGKMNNFIFKLKERWDTFEQEKVSRELLTDNKPNYSNAFEGIVNGF